MPKKRKCTVVKDLILDCEELLSIVDRGASGDEIHRPAIVITKDAERVEGEPMAEPIEKRTLEEILGELSEEDRAVVLAAMQPKEEDAAEEEKAEDGEEDEDEEKKKAEDFAKRDALEKANADLTKRVAALEEEKARTAMAKRCEAEFAHVPGAKIEDVANLLFEAQDNLSKRGIDCLESILKTTNESISETPRFQSVGAPVATGDAKAMFEGFANELRKADPNLTRAQSILRASELKPELHKAYRDSRK